MEHGCLGRNCLAGALGDECEYPRGTMAIEQTTPILMLSGQEVDDIDFLRPQLLTPDDWTSKPRIIKHHHRSSTPRDFATGVDALHPAASTPVVHISHALPLSNLTTPRHSCSRPEYSHSPSVPVVV